MGRKSILLWENRPPRHHWNSRKYKALLILNLRSERGQSGLTAEQVCFYAGISVLSLRPALVKWTEWKYCGRRRDKSLPGWPYRYWLLEHGRRFLIKCPAFLDTDKLDADIELYQRDALIGGELQ
jgi:hypothetical protein